MTAVTDILGQLPIGQLASQLGASKEDTSSAATHAITSLLGGMTHNAQDPQGEVALAKALSDHAKRSPKVEDVDTEEGEKIVKHVLGTTPAKAAKAVSAKTGTDSNLISKLLPMLAPFVLSYLGGQAMKGSSGGGGNILTSVLGGMMGGGAQPAAPAGGGLGGLVGGLLGGGSPQPAAPAGGGLSSMLGGMLGGVLGGGSQEAAPARRTTSTTKRSTSTSGRTSTAKQSSTTRQSSTSGRTSTAKQTSTTRKTTSTRKAAQPEADDGGVLGKIINSIF